MEDLYIAEDPAETHKRKWSRSDLKPWIEFAIANPGNWYRWKEPRTSSFMTHAKSIINRWHSEYMFEVVSRKSNEGKKVFVYLKCLGPKPQVEPQESEGN